MRSDACGKALCGLTLLLSANASASPIDDKYAEFGGASTFLGAATGPELTAPDKVGRFRHYKGGSIFWRPDTGAHVVYGLIRNRWAALGWERSYLGYPMTDELATFDGAGRVTKFQGGQLIWRSATNQVSEVKSTDLIVDWPVPAGEPWRIIQANSWPKAGSHVGPWAYCWDIILAGKPQSASAGMPFVSVADGRIVFVEQSFDSGGKGGNAVIQHLGSGRYASYLHAKKDSFSRRFKGWSGGRPQDLPWDRRPIAKSGMPLAEVSDTGAAVGAHHLHFCVTTKPDNARYSPFESVPVAFRSYSYSTDNGKSWTYAPVGIPKKDQWIRREQKAGPTAPQVNLGASVLNFGSVAGQLTSASGKPFPSGSPLSVVVQSGWGEPLASARIPVSGSNAATLQYEVKGVPAYNNLKVIVTNADWRGTGSERLTGASAAFTVRPNSSTTVDVKLAPAPAR